MKERYKQREVNLTMRKEWELRLLLRDGLRRLDGIQVF